MPDFTVRVEPDLTVHIDVTPEQAWTLLLDTLLIMIDNEGRAHICRDEKEAARILWSGSPWSSRHPIDEWMRIAAARLSGSVRHDTAKHFIRDLDRAGWIKVVHNHGRVEPH
jgi:hypothetical protein